MKTKIKNLFMNKYSMALAMMSASTAASAAPSTSSTDCPEGTIGGLFCNFRQELGEIAALIIAVFYVIGFALTGMGLYFFWKNEQQPNQDHGKKGFIALIVGGALLSITYIVDAMSTSITANDQDTQSLLDAELGEEY